MNKEQTKQVTAMKNEPKVIYLNCYEGEDIDYLPIDNDFDTLDGENVLWSADSPCMDGNIKYVHHSEVTALQARIAELEKQNQEYHATLWEINKVMTSFNGKVLIETGSYFSNKIKRALNQKEG